MSKARAANRVESVYEHWEPLSDEEFALSMTDFREFCKNSIVLDENGTPVTFILNKAQEIVAEKILKALEPIMKKVPCPSIKVLIHKSRQMGITTIFLKLEQYFMTKTKNLNALHIMPTEEECDELKDRKLIPLLQGTHPDLLADMTSTANYVDFNEFEGNILDNRLRYMPSGTRGSGHGRTIHLLVEDEYAKYPDPFTLESGILPAMKGNTARIVLFTAKGMNHAYDLSKEAQREDNSWVYIFLPWYIMDEYEMEPYGKYITMEGLSDYDYFLFSEFKKAGIPPQKWLRKAAWYDYIWREDAKRDWKYMFENYPTIAEESFRASGSPIFDAIKINEWRDRGCRRLDVFTSNGETDFRYVDDGSIKEFEPPVRGHSYVMGVDPADGEIKGDDSALVVWDVSNNKVKAVCAYNGTISQNDFAELISDVGTRYNDALVVPERNTGQLMIKWLTEVCQYTNIYTDAQKVSGYNNLGVYTSPGVKNEMIARLKFLIANGYYEDFDPTFCEQANYFTYEKTPSGQYRAAATAGHHDDTVMCFTAKHFVKTVNGDIPIKALRPGDYVLTRDGYKRVEAISSQYKPVVDRGFLTGTPEHPIITPNGIAPLQDINIHDTLYVWKNPFLSSTTTKNTLDILTQKEDNSGYTTGTMESGNLPLLHFTVKSILTTLVRYPKGTMYTIKTAIRSTIVQKILKHYQLENISNSVQATKKTGRRISKRILTWLENRQKKQSAKFAGRSMKRKDQTLVNTVLKNADGTQTQYENGQEVINLQVEGKHEYFVDGVLVHNCRCIATMALDMERFAGYNQQIIREGRKY